MNVSLAGGRTAAGRRAAFNVGTAYRIRYVNGDGESSTRVVEVDAHYGISVPIDYDHVGAVGAVT